MTPLIKMAAAAVLSATQRKNEREAPAHRASMNPSNMDQEQHIAVLSDILVAIAPGIAARALDKLSLTVDPYRDNPAQGYSAARREIFREHAEMALEIASHLAGQFALMSDAALLSAQAQDALAKSFQGKKNPAS